MTSKDGQSAPRRCATATMPGAERAPALSVIVPVHNEAGNIPRLVDEIAGVLRSRLIYEMVFVDDASEDDSAAVLAAALVRHPELRVVRHRNRCGQSAAILTGVQTAKAAWIATLDGDGQNDPADIPALLVVRDTSTDPTLLMVAGVRLKRRDSLTTRLSSRLANGIRRRVLHDGATDTGCGIKLFRRDAFLALPRFDHMHRFLPALVKRGGGAVVEVAVNHRPRGAGQSHYGVLDRTWIGLIDMAGVAWLQRRTKIPIVEHKD